MRIAPRQVFDERPILRLPVVADPQQEARVNARPGLDALGQGMAAPAQCRDRRHPVEQSARGVFDTLDWIRNFVIIVCKSHADRGTKTLSDSDPLFTLLVFGAIIAVAWLIMTVPRQKVMSIGDLGQGIMGIATAVALGAGAFLYYLQGSNKPRLEVSSRAAVVPLTPQGDGTGRVLIQFVGTVTNRGAFSQHFECVGVDVRGFDNAAQLERNRIFQYDVATAPLLADAANGPEWDHCMQIERIRWGQDEDERLARLRLPPRDRQPFPSIDSGLRYAAFDLESGESRTRHVELVVPCNFAAVRYHFVIPKPHSRYVYEDKAVVDIGEQCRRSRELVASGAVRTSAPDAAGGQPARRSHRAPPRRVATRRRT